MLPYLMIIDFLHTLQLVHMCTLREQDRHHRWKLMLGNRGEADFVKMNHRLFLISVAIMLGDVMVLAMTIGEWIPGLGFGVYASVRMAENLLQERPINVFTVIPPHFVANRDSV